MDASSTAMIFTHLFIIWTLLSVLLVWILLFVFLALRPDKEKMAEGVEEPTPLFTIQTPVAQSAVSSPTHARIYESVSEAAPII